MGEIEIGKREKSPRLGKHRGKMYKVRSTVQSGSVGKPNGMSRRPKCRSNVASYSN